MQILYLNLFFTSVESGSLTAVYMLQLSDDMRKRSKTALQFVSHCKTDSDREEYIEQLKHYVNVTQIGKCGIRNCSKECEEKAISR